MFEKYKNFVFGNELTFDLQKRIFLLITHLSILIGLVGIIINIILGLEIFLTVVTILTVLIVIYFHIKVRNSKFNFYYALTFFLTSIIVFSLLWFYNGGYNGNTIVLFFVYYVAIVTILPAKLRFFSFIVYALLILTLMLGHFYFPGLVSDYGTQPNRFIDLIIGYLLYLILAYNIQNIILKNYEKDREHINIQNEQLNTLVEKLNDVNNKLELSFKKVNELNSTKDRFITVLSHDLRSPFQGLLGITKTLEANFSSFSDDEKQFYIIQVNHSLDKLYAFLEQLLLWGRIQRTSLMLSYTRGNVKEVIDQTLSVLSETASKKKILIDINCPDSLISEFDKEMLSVVLRNLLSNAIKFSPVGSWIKITAKLDNDELKISVADNGVGISDESINKLFNLDENFSTIGTDNEQGSGMGLILCNDIIKKHNGKISVQSKEGKGSTFTIIIPGSKK
jgi:two-component system, sensor histidine kinase and response regulator